MTDTPKPNPSIAETVANLEPLGGAVVAELQARAAKAARMQDLHDRLQAVRKKLAEAVQEALNVKAAFDAEVLS